LPEQSGPRVRADDPLASDGVVVDGERYPLSTAIGEVWGRTGIYPTHFNVDLTLADGRFLVTPIVVDGQDASVREPSEASAVLRAELYDPGAPSFAFADYIHVADPEAPGVIDALHFFTGARLGVDSDGSGEVETEEMRDVVGGTIDFEGPSPDISLTFALVLEDGASVVGRYGGFFEFIPLD